MPIIDITFPEGALDTKTKEALPAKLGQIALGYDGLSGSRFAEAFTWVYTHELPRRIPVHKAEDPHCVQEFCVATGLAGINDLKIVPLITFNEGVIPGLRKIHGL